MAAVECLGHEPQRGVVAHPPMRDEQRARAGRGRTHAQARQAFGASRLARGAIYVAAGTAKVDPLPKLADSCSP